LESRFDGEEKVPKVEAGGLQVAVVFALIARADFDRHPLVFCHGGNAEAEQNGL